MKKIALFVLFLSLAFDGNAKQQTLSSKCGDASLEILADDRSEDDAMGFNEVVISVNKEKNNLTVKEDSPDIFMLGCLTNKNNKSYLVYQSVCSGSGCRDLDNFGVIDTGALKVLIKPDDNNRNKTSKIIGLKADQIISEIEKNKVFPKK